MLKSLLAFLVILTLIIVILSIGLSQPAPVDAFGTIITIPSLIIPTYIDAFVPVDIPDANLKAALHDACGKALTETLTRGDLAALTGSLNLAGLHIANLEGVQYCANILHLNGNVNPLSALPDMSRMTALNTLRLDQCAFTAIPASIRDIPNLLSLSMAGNALEDIAAVSGCTSLLHLHLYDNQLRVLPDPLSLPALETLNLSDNQLEDIPEVILGLTHLRQLFINDNQIEIIPAGLAALPDLFMLSLAGNRIRSIPAELGGSQLESLFLKRNRVNTLPSALLDAPNLIILDIGANRLTTVPAKLKDRAYDLLDFQFNYIDLSPGSAARDILIATTAFTKYYEAQLTPVRNLQGTSASDQITLTWDACPDTDTGAYTTTVSGYVVYHNPAGTLVQLASLDKATCQYTDSNLPAGTQRKYTVAVVYDIVAPMLVTTSRHYTSITLAVATPTPEPSLSPVPTTTVQPTQQTGEQPAQTSDAATSEMTSSATQAQGGTSTQPDPDRTAGGTGAPLWLVIVLAAVALAGIAAAVVLLIMRKKA